MDQIVTSKRKVPSKQLHLLDLPPELRNNIYEKVVESQPRSHLTTRTRGNLASASALPRVCRQIRNGFISVLYLRTSNIVASVKDYDFRHVVTFLNKLSDLELTSLVDVSFSRKMTIELTLKSPHSSAGFWRGSERHALLNRWLKRLTHPTKRGTKIEASYVLLEGNTWQLEHEYEHLKHKGDFQKAEEVRKIVASIDENRGWFRGWSRSRQGDYPLFS